MDPKLEKLRATIHDAIEHMTPEDFSRCQPGKWNSAEILEHLNLTYTGTLKNMQKRLAEGKPCAEGNRRQKKWQRLAVISLGYFPSGRKSPERALPRGAPLQQVMQEIILNLERMDAVIAECERCFPANAPIAEHPVLGPLTGSEWRGFHLAHGRHHVRQIRRLRKLSTP
jgi:hypothetical protein